MLNEEQKNLYSRHLLIPEFEDECQEKLLNATVLVIGAGGLGAPVLLYLTAAGIGNIKIVEDDKVARHNLQRQILYKWSEVEEDKIDKAEDRLKALNPKCNITKYSTRWLVENAYEIAEGCDVIVDCTDNYESRLLTDKISAEMGIPFVYGAINNWEGQVAVFNYNGGKRYADTFNFENLDNSSKNPVGVIGVLPGVTGSMQAAEVIKILSGQGEVLSDKLLIFSLKNNSYNTLSL
jgi:molybdopterin/thiamine biosynthesis adenylyltransferase